MSTSFRTSSLPQRLPQRHRLAAAVVILAAAVFVPRSAAAQESTIAPNAPVDAPVTATRACQVAALEQALAPLIAEARATFPEARRRWVADRTTASAATTTATTPASARAIRPMYVTTRLRDAGGRTEQIFVKVDSLVGDRIVGRIASQIQLVTGYAYRQPHAFPEAQLLDWMFPNPDGTEEGNVLGKFIDTYRPPADCRGTDEE